MGKIMDEIQKEEKNLTPTPEELKQEEEALKESPTEELRKSIIQKYELDEYEQGDLIDRMLEEALEQRKSFGKVIEQKRKWREKAQSVQPSVQAKGEVQQKNQIISDNEIDKRLEEKLEKRELEALDLSDELKKEVAVYAKLNGVSIKKALASDYIQFKKDKEESNAFIDDASLGGNKRGITGKDYSQIDTKKLDHTTEKGKADFARWEEEQRKLLG